MMQPTNDFSDAPPISFGSRRLYYQYSVAVPQTHMTLVSILQGVAFGSLLVQPFPLPPATTGLSLDFLLAHYFFLPYLVSSLIILTAWMDLVYASVVLIWPPTAFQAGMIYFLAVFEVIMVRQIDNLPLWVTAAGLVTIIGGIARWNNRIIFTKDDFADAEVGTIILRNEGRFGSFYITLGAIGVVFGVTYNRVYSLTQTFFPTFTTNTLVHWISYINLVVDIALILYIDIRYRQWLLKKLTANSDFEVTRFGGLRQKYVVPSNVPPTLKKVRP